METLSTYRASQNRLAHLGPSGRTAIPDAPPPGMGSAPHSVLSRSPSVLSLSRGALAISMDGYRPVPKAQVGPGGGMRISYLLSASSCRGDRGRSWPSPACELPFAFPSFYFLSHDTSLQILLIIYIRFHIRS
jgi:hypothetical protein